MKKMDLNSPEKLLNVNSEPNATNSSTSISAFYQKKLYEIKAFQHPFLSQNKPINILYEKQYYGRVNLQHVPVMCDQNTLKLFNEENGTIVILQNFAIDAYKDFISYWEFLKKRDRISKSGLIQNVNAKTSFLNAGELYFYYMSSMYEEVKKTINDKKIVVKNFDDFLKCFIDYVDSVTPAAPITFSSFIGSRVVSPLISGICFDIVTSDTSIDAAKYSLFMKDSNYAIFKKTATKFGFFIDKQVPWRLWADIDSPALKPYMDNYNLNQSNLYDINYIPAYSYDLELIRFYLLQFYNTYVISNSSIKQPEFKVCKKGTISVDYKNINLDSLTVEQVAGNKQFDRLFMKSYLYIKMRENNYSWNKSYFENILNNFIQIKEALDLPRAMLYIVPLVKIPAESSRIHRNFQFY